MAHLFPTEIIKPFITKIEASIMGFTNLPPIKLSPLSTESMSRLQEALFVTLAV